MAVVELKNVSKIYDNKLRVISNVNLTINDREFVVLVGPSGCGKTTTLRMIAGLEEIIEKLGLETGTPLPQLKTANLN